MTCITCVGHAIYTVGYYTTIAMVYTWAAPPSRAQPKMGGCPSFPPVPTNVQLQLSKVSRGEEWEG